MCPYQKTLSNRVVVEGKNVYLGNGKIYATFIPAEEDTGIVFYYRGKEVQVLLPYARNKKRAIFLENGEVEIGLVEHLLSAVYALGITNVIIELSKPVCPTLPDSALGYYEALKENIVEQGKKAKRVVYVGEKEVLLFEGKPDYWIVGEGKGLSIYYVAEYPHKAVGRQEMLFVLDGCENYKEEIAWARSPVLFTNSFYTHLFLALGKLGIHGIDKENYFIIPSLTSLDPLNPQDAEHKIKANTEFVRHKILDVIGTLALLGGRVENVYFIIYKSGHKTDLRALSYLVKEGKLKLIEEA